MTVIKLIGFGIVLTGLLSTTGCELNNNPDPGNQKLTHKDSLCIMLLSNVRQDSIGLTVDKLTEFSSRFALAPNRKEIALAIRDMFKKVGYENAAIDSFQASKTWNGQDYTTWQYNVIAELEGTVHPDSVNIVCAHYDDIVTNGDPFTHAPGANDNASGVAGMIEVARVMKYTGYKPAISTRFVALAAEEIGLLGSADFAGKLALSGKPVNIVINHDMIAKVNNPNYLFWTMKIIFNANSFSLANGTSSLCSKYIGIYVLGDSTKSRKVDSYPFSQKGFKAMSFTSADSDINYHTTNDLTIYCNIDYSSLITGLSCVTLVYHD